MVDRNKRMVFGSKGENHRKLMLGLINKIDQMRSVVLATCKEYIVY
jgi:hypothetical protein